VLQRSRAIAFRFVDAILQAKHDFEEDFNGEKDGNGV
jgi:hypothetical protein